jgi:hypothetical protein
MIQYTINYIDTSGVSHIECYKATSQENALKALKHPVKQILYINPDKIF